jgi:hypothetical protein
MTNGENGHRIRAVEAVILTVRGHKVILDVDLAAWYGVEVKRLNEQVRRNRPRFPLDFVFQLAPQEVIDLRSQSATSSSGGIRLQSATALHGGRRYRPYAFTEHGAIMAATVLNNPRAVEMSIFVVRAFIRMREALLSRHETEQRLDQIEKILLVHDNSLRDLYEKIRPLLLPAPEAPQKEVTGFRVRERRALYGTRRQRRPTTG